MATAKELRPVLLDALRAGFADRGWVPRKRSKGVFQLAIPGTELVVEWDTAPEGYKYGGMLFGGSGGVLAPEVSAELLTFPGDIWPEPTRGLPPEDRASWARLAGTTSGRLLGPRGSLRTWTVQSDTDLEAAVAEFFAMIDGPGVRWIRSVTPVGTLLDWAVWGRGRAALPEDQAELVALIALHHDRPAVARAVLETSRARSTEPEVIDAFVRELEARQPGALSRAAAPLTDHPLWRPLTHALDAGFRSRGWSPSSRRAGAFEIASADGLTVSWSPGIEVAGEGGLRFGGVGLLESPSTTETLLGFPADARPWAFDGVDARGAQDLAWLAITTAGRLLDPQGDEPLWTVRLAAEVEAAMTAFFAMVDGPLAEWMRTTATLKHRLAVAAAPPQELRPSRVRYELLILLALQHRRRGAAREIARAGIRYFPEPVGRFGRFENEVARRSWLYGRRQVQNGDRGGWLIDRNKVRLLGLQRR